MTRHESLPVELSGEEVRLKGRELAGKVREYSDVESEKKQVTKDYADRLKRLRAEMDGLEVQIRTGREFRGIEVRDEPDYNRGVVVVVRTDTEQVVRSRPMEPDERQASLLPIRGGRAEQDSPS